MVLWLEFDLCWLWSLFELDFDAEIGDGEWSGVVGVPVWGCHRSEILSVAVAMVVKLIQFSTLYFKHVHFIEWQC